MVGFLEQNGENRKFREILDFDQIFNDFGDFVVLLQKFDHRREGLVSSDEISSVKSPKRPFLMI